MHVCVLGTIKCVGRCELGRVCVSESASLLVYVSEYVWANLSLSGYVSGYVREGNQKGATKGPEGRKLKHMEPGTGKLKNRN